MGIIFASGFLYLYLLYVQKPLSTSLGDEKDKKGMQGRVKLPCTGSMRLLASRCVVCRFVVIPTVTVSYCLFRGILGLCVNVSMPLQLFSIVSPSAWCLSIVTDGHASSDWSPGPMLVGVHLGVICVVIGSSLMFLVFFVYVFDKEKFVHICFITTGCTCIYSGMYTLHTACLCHLSLTHCSSYYAIVVILM